jgi:hypothetical protein
VFPLKVRFSRTIKEQIHLEQVPHLLDISRDILSEAGADYFSKENNRLKFDNRLFKLTWNWNLMIPIDAGFVEIELDNNSYAKIRYSITLTRIWVISALVAIIVWIADSDVIGPLMAFGTLGVLNWLIVVLRHWIFLNTMTDKMIDNLMKD